MAAAELGQEDDLVYPPEDLSSMLDLARFLQSHQRPGLLVGEDGEQMPLPLEVNRVLQHAVEALRKGKAVHVAPQNLVLTTQEAADLLDVSRPTLVKLLDAGAIPFDQPNRHRRVRLDDVLEYRARRHAAQRAALDELTAEASALGLYEDSATDYTAALESTRRRSALKECE